MKKSFLILLLILGIFSIFTNFVGSNTLSDIDDRFAVDAPAPNQLVLGTIGVRFIAYDDEQSSIPFTAQIFDRATCSDTNYGSITSQSTAPSNASIPHEFSWNSKSTNSTANLLDGEYCIKICLSLKNNSTNYSACNSRSITIINQNRSPVITSTPLNLTIYEDSTWEYQIVASDPDGNPLTYSLLESPAFLSINSATGLVSTNTNSKVLPSGTTKLDYTVRVGVSDGIAATVTQEFTLTILKRGVSIDDSNGNNDSGQSPDRQSKVEVITPTENEIFKGSSNEIKWKISDPDGIKEIKIRYSKDQIGWVDIKTLSGIETDLTSTNFDVSQISDGAYYIEFRVKDELDDEISKISPKFIIRNDDNNGNFSSEPLIINVDPASNSQNSEVSKITGEFVASIDQEIDTKTFEITLDDNDIKSLCEVTKDVFTCTLEENLSNGLHKAKVKISDSAEKTTEYEWQFRVGEENPVSFPTDSEDNDSSSNLFGRDIPHSLILISLGICCLASLLILIPWILYSMWFRSDTDDDNYYGDSQTTAPVQPTVTTNYYNPGLSDYGYVSQNNISAQNPDNYYMPPTAENTYTTEPPITLDMAPQGQYQEPTSYNFGTTPAASDYTTTAVTPNYYEPLQTDTVQKSNAGTDTAPSSKFDFILPSSNSSGANQSYVEPTPTDK